MARLKNVVARAMKDLSAESYRIDFKKRVVHYLYLKEGLHRSDLDQFMRQTYRTEPYGNEPWPLVPVEKMQRTIKSDLQHGYQSILLACTEDVF